jgi:plastocyanin
MLLKKAARKTFRHLACISFLLLLGGCSGPAYNPPAALTAAVVDMGFMSYRPSTVTIKPGDTVEWRNSSFLTHTVTDEPTRAEVAGSAKLPAGAATFNSGDIPAGQIYTHRFLVPGTYRYFCKHHDKHGMIGTIVVSAGVKTR